MKKIIIGISLIITIIVGIVIVFKPKEKEVLKLNKDIYKVECLEETKQELFTNYQDFSKVIESKDIKEKDFEKYNYYLFSITYDSCGERNIIPTNYKIGNKKINITVKYEASCGVCAPEYLYYVLKVEKEVKEKEIILDYKAINKPSCDPNVAYKPIIYLYPEEEQDIEVKFIKDENLTITYPKYKDGWFVHAYKDGTLKIGDREYYGLYWEGVNHNKKQTNEGFVIKGEETISFLEEKLKLLGLNDKEANEFIIYWLPKLENNPYNYIRFETIEEINEYMPIMVNPSPETIIRIQMDYKPLYSKIDVKEQKLIKQERKGYSLIEWGGSLIK